MTHLIDKDALVAEIERRKQVAFGWMETAPNDAIEAEIELCNDILSFLETLEVKEVYLEKENVTSVWHSKDDMPMAGKVIFVTYDGLDAKRILTWQKDFITIAIDKWAYVDDLLKL